MSNVKHIIIGYILIAAAVVLLCVVWYKNSPHAGVPIVFSEKNMLSFLWTDYKNEYIEKDTGRALDKQQNNITTSEGQSYTMLRAVWMDDKPTFDLAYKWTNDNLKRKEDHLFAWLFGKKTDGSYGVLTERGGYNAASDADTDIALALVFAGNRWKNDAYTQAAKDIINDIWAKEVVVLNGVPYMTANNLENTQSAKPIINPSYFAPYAYRIFSKIDTKHDWMGLVKSSYDVLDMTSNMKLDGSDSASVAANGAAGTSTAGAAAAPASGYLPPDWIVINRTSGKISESGIQSLTTNFGYDALRVPWKIALDYKWYGEPRAKAYLDSLGSLGADWTANKSLSSVRSHDNQVVTADEAAAMYGGSIGYFMVSDPAAAKEVYEQKLIFLVNPDTNDWKTSLGYYDANWVWFGIGAYNNLLPNLSE